MIVDNLHSIFEMWQVKLFIGSILAIFAPFDTAILILFIMIILDTITGVSYSLRIKKFSSARFRKGVLKFFTYFAAVLVARLLELGIDEIVSVTIITKLMLSFLILTEAISVLENLILLDVPLPADFIKLILNKIKNKTFKDIVEKGIKKKDYMDEIDDMLMYQIGNIKSESLKKLLTIKFQEWKNAVNLIDNQLSNDNNINDNELLYYKVSSIITSTNSLINDEWIEAGIPEKCINNFNTTHSPRVSKWLDYIKQICNSVDSIDNKKDRIIARTIIVLYQTIVDAQKADNIELKDKCSGMDK